MTITGASRAKKPRHSATPALGLEFRRFAADGIEVRNDAENNAIVISGMPIVYNQAYQVRDMFGEFSETMLPGVADSVLAGGADVRFLINHDGLPLARTLSGTLTLDGANTRGLPMAATLDARSSMANDLAVAIERGDVSQMSCGFVVGVDDWPSNDVRNISQFKSLFDVSAVTYPASPTTSIEIAQRSLMAHPVQAQARMRRLWVQVGKDFREGRAALTEDNTTKLQTMLAALNGADVPELDETPEPEAAETALVQRDAPPATTEARRAAVAALRDAGSYNDRENALSDAITDQFGPSSADSDGDGDNDYFDMWLVDASDTWVVWQSYGDWGPGEGLWQVGYTADADLNVTFVGDPIAVNVQKTYVPDARDQAPDVDVEARESEVRAALAAVELEAEQLRLRGRRRHAA